MKMSLLEFLDRTGLHVSRKTFEKYKGKKKSLKKLSKAKLKHFIAHTSTNYQ